MKRKIRIGIPRGLLYYRDYILWKTFFEGIGCTLILSPPTNKGIIDTTAGWVNNLIETQEIISVTPDGYTVNTEKINSVKTKYQSLVNAAKKGAINNGNLNTYKKNFIS